MDSRAAYTLRLEKAVSRQQRLGMIAVSGVALGAAALLLAGSGKPHGALALQEASTPSPTAASASQAGAAQANLPRRIYPYSIIPGGVLDVAELKQVLRNDRVVAAHYADFNVDKARAIKVTKARAVYVSYRKGDQVYWTAKKLMLVPGETLFTDGEHEMRGRCANRISDVPRFPVEPDGPTEVELDLALEGVPGMEGGGFLITSADMGLGGDVDGQRFHPVSFVNDPGPATPDTPARRRDAPSVPDVDRSDLYRYGIPGTSMRLIHPPEDSPAVPAPVPAPEPGSPGDDQPSPPTPSVPEPQDQPEPPGDGMPPVAPPAAPPLPVPAPPQDTELAPPPLAEVPVPGTLWLSGFPLAGLLWLRRKAKPI